MTRHPTAPATVFGVLGPVEAATDLGPVALKGNRQRAVLARLLIARGRVVPVERIVDDLWDVPPRGAVAAIRTFVSDLRRALEPDRPSRRPAQLLVTAPPGYALRAAPDAVDAWRFEATVGESAQLLATAQATRALADLDRALALWRGPAYAEFAEEHWARAEIHRLDELRILALERRAEAQLALGRAAEAAFDLRTHVDNHPLREDAWQLLATALYRAGRQGEALAALRQARERLVAELGLDPGPRLRQLETDILGQAPHLHPAVPQSPTARGAPATIERPQQQQRPFVGRDEELARLQQAAEAVVQHRRPTLVLISADAGEGKTALAEALTQRLAARGWRTAWGRNPEFEDAPVTWPWAQITAALTASGAAEPDGMDQRFTEDPAVARFRRRRSAVTQLAAVADQAPVLLVVDDLHRADDGTLDLLTGLVGEPQPVAGPVLIIGTYRATEITPELTAALARFARAEPVRIYLGGLSETATAELADSVAGPALDAPTVRLIHRRSGGNPFFIRELSRLLAAEGGAALEKVPAGVRDVIRHRLARLPDSTRTVLQQAAVIGRDVDVDVLAALALGRPPVLDALDSALRAGFLTEQDADPRLRFTHILVRDTLYGDLSALRRASWHAAVAETIERLRPHDVAALAYHFTRAANRATAPRAAHYAHAAAEQAERRFSPHEAARLWRQAIEAHDRAGGNDPRERLAAVMGLGRALALTGQLVEARRHRSEAITAAEELADLDVTACVITAFDVPAIWTRNDDERLSHQIVDAAERAVVSLDQTRPAQRSRLLSTIALELRGTTSDRGHRAAIEAEAIARESGDPALLAFALNARFMHMFYRTGLAGDRARIGAELVELASRHRLVTFEVLGRLILIQAHSALDDLAAADVHARAADRLAEQYDLPLVGVFTDWYAALRLAVGGRVNEAEAAYRAADARLIGSGMPGMQAGLLPLALLSLRGHPPAGAWRWGPDEPWVRPVILLSAGRSDEAAAALRDMPESPHDLLYEARLCLAARAALAVGDRGVMANLYAQLLPAADELAGAGSGILTLGPVARYLDDLAVALGYADETANRT